MELFANYISNYSAHQEQEMTLVEYLELCKNDPTAYESPAQRMLRAIGEPDVVDTTKDPRLSRIFYNRKINVYPTFSDFYGMEDTIELVVKHFRHAAQGLEEKKQILYLLGPVGGGKSSLVEKLKELFETVPFYTIKAGDTISPLYESPFGLFDAARDGAILERDYGIPRNVLKPIMSPWATKRLREFGGDVSKFKVVRMYPSQLNRVAVAKAEPGDENNQDMSTLVGKVDIRKLEYFSQDDPDAYSYSGALNVTPQGLFDFAEMFKANLKTLHPLLTATQEGHYNGTEGFASMPYAGIIVAHSNQSEWEVFRNNTRNEAFLDRVNTIKVPYCLRVSDEEKIYEKLIQHSSLRGLACAPGTLEMLARFCGLTRMVKPQNSSLFSKLEVYDGKSLKDRDPNAKSYQEYRDEAGVNEGMTGVSTRFAYKVLSHTFNFDSTEVAANPVHLMYVLENRIKEDGLNAAVEEEYISYIKGILAPKYATFIADEIQKAYLESYGEYGQNLFDRYIMYADAWIQNDADFRDPDTGESYDKSSLNDELEKIEKAAGVVNAKDFRNEVVNFVLRARANNNGKNVSWTSYEKLRNVIEKRIFANTEDLLPVISFNKKATSDEESKHHNFVQRMVDRGYTERQVRLLVEWYLRYRKHS